MPADDPLAQQTRAQIYALLVELEDGATTAELATRLKLHPNGVRAHLAILGDAGLVTKQTVRHGQGRPRDVWRVPPHARADAPPPSGYRELAAWLAAATPAGDRSAVEATGRAIGRRLAQRERQATEYAGVESTMAVLGFRPSRRELRDGAVSFCLGNCPYKHAVRANAEIVCGLHRGITLGLLDEFAPDAEMTAFEPQDPERAGCLIEIGAQPDAAVV